MNKLVLVSAALAIGVGCGGTTVYHCDFVATGAEDRCQERSNDIPGPGAELSAETYKETCETAGGRGGDGPCPSGDVVSGCNYDAEGAEEVIDYYYAPMTVADAEADCDGTSFTP